MVVPDKENCCGCEACISACPVNTISEGYDSLGFVIPKVDTNICIDCGRCDRVCPFLKKNFIQDEGFIQRAIAARNLDTRIVERSRSGGVFAAIANDVIRKGGVVYGAAMDTRQRVVHIRVEREEDIPRLMGSKYAQSRMNGIFEELLIDLKQNKEVLFSGTPCQIKAVKEFIPSVLHATLVTIDIICHGVGSPVIWQKFVEYVEKMSHGNVLSADFRDKLKYGWDGLHKESYVVEGLKGKQIIPYIYYNDNHIRHSCNNCPFSSVNRVSDITLGDLWNWRKVAKFLNKDGKGCSLVLLNSHKGNLQYKAICHNLYTVDTKIEDVQQANMLQPTNRSKSRDKYEQDFLTIDFKELMTRYHSVANPPLITMIKNKLIHILRRCQK